MAEGESEDDGPVGARRARDEAAGDDAGDDAGDEAGGGADGADEVGAPAVPKAAPVLTELRTCWSMVPWWSSTVARSAARLGSGVSIMAGASARYPRRALPSFPPLLTLTAIAVLASKVELPGCTIT
jgi:hypothetical protein